MKLSFPISALAVAAALTLTACQPKDSPPAVGNAAFAGLGGTSWQLVEVQSMDDSQGTTRPSDPARYTISFGKNGQLAARLECNRGVGSWKNEIANATGGSLAIGPLGVTKMLCPEGGLGEKLEKQLGYVRSFIIRDGWLYMSLMADGGIIVWEPMNAKK